MKKVPFVILLLLLYNNAFTQFNSVKEATTYLNTVKISVKKTSIKVDNEGGMFWLTVIFNSPQYGTRTKMSVNIEWLDEISFDMYEEDNIILLKCKSNNVCIKVNGKKNDYDASGFAVDNERQAAKIIKALEYIRNRIR